MPSVSSEPRTPWHIIIECTQLLQLNNQDDAQRKYLLGLVRQAGKHLLTLIEQILAFSKIEAGKI